MASLVRIDEFLPYIARRVTIAFGYSHAWRENETDFGRHEHRQALFVQRCERRCKVLLRSLVKRRHTQRRQ